MTSVDRLAIDDAMSRDVDELFARMQRELDMSEVYSVGIGFDCEEQFQWVTLLANDHDTLEKTALHYAAGCPGTSLSAWREYLRFQSFGDWPFKEFLPRVDSKLQEVDPEDQRDCDVAIYASACKALRSLDSRELLGPPERRRRITLGLFPGDSSNEFIEGSVHLLNPPEVATGFRIPVSPYRS